MKIYLNINKLKLTQIVVIIYSAALCQYCWVRIKKPICVCLFM